LIDLTNSLVPKSCLELVGIFLGGLSAILFPGVKSAGGIGGGAGMGVEGGLECLLLRGDETIGGGGGEESLSEEYRRPPYSKCGMLLEVLDCM